MSKNTIKSIAHAYLVFDKYNREDKPVPNSFWIHVANVWESENDDAVTANAMRKKFIKLNKKVKNDDLTVEDIVAFLSSDEDKSHLGIKRIKQYLDENDINVSEFDLELGEDQEEDEEEEEIVNKVIISDLKDRWYFNSSTGQYIFHLKSAPKPKVISEEDLRLMKERYSNWDGVDSTINEISRDFGIPRSWFIEIKSILGWTHDSDPFLDQEILDGDDEELIEEVLQKRKNNIYMKFERAKWDDIRKDAEKYNQIETTIYKPIMQKINTIANTGMKVSFSDNLPKYDRTGKTFLLAPFDIHVGKIDILETYKYDYEKYYAIVLETFEALLYRLFDNGIPKRIICPMGNDFFHIDNAMYATTKGTNQAGHFAGTYFDMLIWASKLGYEMMDMLADLCEDYEINLDIIHVSGNHDKILASMFSISLQEKYKDNHRVNVMVNQFDRKYISSGNNLFLFTHGEHIPRSQSKRELSLSKFLTREAKINFGIDINRIDHYYSVTGHYHSLSINDRDGVVDIVCPSLSKTDIWHDENGYNMSEKKIAGFIFDDDTGIEQIILLN